MRIDHPPSTPTTRRTVGRARLCASLVCLLVATGHAQVPPAAAPTGPGVAEPEYTVGPADLLAIRVYGVPDLDQTTRVSNSGKIRVAHLGIIPVAGLTVRQLEGLLSESLRTRGLVKQPWVQVRVEQFRARPVYILGEVVQPGQYVITGKMYLLDLIGKAEGLTAKAHPTAYLYRLGGGPPASGTEGETPGAEPTIVSPDTVLEVDLADLTQGKRPEANIELRGGDVLYVREALPDFYYVVGDVKSPGTFELAHNVPVRLSFAVANAGGPLRTAKMSQGVLVRSDSAGVTEQVQFDYKKVLAGQQPDVVLRPNDIVYIPGSQAKTLGYALLGIVPGVTVGATTGAMR
jgi:polysaccharide export outer membrane protein